MKIKINFDLIPRFNQPHRFRGYMTSGIADIDRRTYIVQLADEGSLSCRKPFRIGKPRKPGCSHND
jgi:hypothetical protein